MLVRQKNELFALVKEAGMPFQEFAWENGSPSEMAEARIIGGTVESIKTLRHIPSNYFFSFYLAQEVNCYVKAKRSPGASLKQISTCAPELRLEEWEDAIAQEYSANSLTMWNGLVLDFKDWLADLKKETELDLWSQQKTPTIENIDLSQTPSEDEHFTPEERLHLASSVAEFKQLIVSEIASKIEPQKLEEIEQRLNYLVESSERLGKKDWQLVAIGLITNIVSSLIVSPETMSVLLTGANALFGWAFAHTTMTTLS